MLNVLIHDVSSAGVSKFRFTDPHKCLQKNHGDEFTVDFNKSPNILDANEMSKYDLFFTQAGILLSDKFYNALIPLKKQGLKIIVDIDDYWRLPKFHGLYKKMEGQWKKMVSRFNIADMMTTTTEHLATQVRKYNKNVVVIPNAINPNEKQFKPQMVESEKLRLGFVGGSTHKEDFKLMRGLSHHLQNKHPNKIQMVMCGFNKWVKNADTGEKQEVEFPKVWMECEHIISGGYYKLSEEYRSYLLRPTKTPFDGEEGAYKRIWTKPVQKYGTCYNHLDIALAPLVNDTFNRMKSQLKIIEAGFHKKALIASHIAPYRIDGIHEKNCMLVKEKKSKQDYVKYARKLLLNPNMRVDLGLALYEAVKAKYDLNNVTKLRAEAYKNL